ncbi:GGDEF domain-containing protein [Marinomonas mediterranea]|uniref:GGDEF domain-containing protein n=1 Tax=Marinomonas mediterranea TaxID=119864 RepID=UPI00234B49E1|nr:GGDEF domain-containing protein [Marinomonas mediterranea]WCN10698.1 EAL domain-containing protein [Marinomonas mediterranea]
MQDNQVQLLHKTLSEGLVTPYFQPIFDLRTGEVFGHEALSRGPIRTPLFAPDVLFPLAESENKLHELEILCRSKALSRFVELDLNGKLFLNVSASLLSSPHHQRGMTLSILRNLGLDEKKIVIELSEQHPYDRDGLSHNSVNHYREMGFQVAIDDLGAGYSGLRLWSELQPDIVKIDKHFIQGIDQDDVKQEFVRSIIAIGQRLKCTLIAEGIETRQELDQVIELGIPYGQGYFLGRPTPSPSDTTHLYLAKQARKKEQFDSNHGETVWTLCKPSPSVKFDSPLRDVAKLFSQHHDLFVVPVLDNGQPIGVIRRHALHELFSTPYGRALYEHKAATNLLSEDTIIVESSVSLASVSTMLTEQEADTLNNEIIIVKGGQYIGTGHLRDLLKRITELKIQNATYSNPLTLLPGNVPIHKEVNRRLTNLDNFHVAYFDLNDFKPFNDYFGYAKGDEVIQLLGNIIREETHPESNFIGHIGGDDFVVIFADDNWHEQCEAILTSFDQRVRTFYDADTLLAGGVWSPNRHGETVFHPILSLSIGVVNPDPAKCNSHHYVAELAAQAKKAAKKQGGNSVYLLTPHYTQASLTQTSSAQASLTQSSLTQSSLTQTS